MVLRTAILFTIGLTVLLAPIYLSADGDVSNPEKSALGFQLWQTDDPAPVSISPETQVVNIGVGPWLNRETQSSDFAPILKWLEESTGYDCVLNISPDYESLESDLLNGYVDVAILSAAAYSSILRTPNVETRYIATVMAGAKEKPSTYYRGYIFTREDSDARDLQSLKGKPFAFVDRGSSSGFQYPMALMLNAGLRPSEDFAQIFYLGSHDRVVTAVVDKQVYGGAVWDDTLISAQAKGHAFQVLAKTAPIPREAWVAGAKTDPVVVENIRSALVRVNLESKTQNGQLALSGGYLYAGFQVESPAFYEGVDEMENILEQFRELSAAGSDDAKR